KFSPAIQLKFFIEKNNLIVDFGFGMGLSKSFLEYIFKTLKINQTILILDEKLPIRICLDKEFHEKYISFGETSSWEVYVEESNNVLPIPIEIPFLILGLSFDFSEIQVIELESSKEKIMIERSIEFKPEHYQAGLGILNYFGTVMRKKYPEQNAKVRIEQEDNTVRLVVESPNGDKEIIERAFDEFGLVIHRDIQPENFYDNYLDIAELKTKLGNFETELKFQHQLVEMKEHRIIELKKDKEFLENIIGKALVRPNSPIYINNQLHNFQSTVINYKAELIKSNDELEELIDLTNSEALRNKLAMIQNALEIQRNSEKPEDVKDSNGMKKLAKFLKDTNEVGSEANNLAQKGGEALELIKSLGRRYNSIAEWCGMPIIPSVLVKK
ncbi:hypothetical protein, partial [Acinetobacter seifertii]|uniref:hypothetical protein n=1 Tax=Acinetobacter seifertii TaxID=1530123 RepID=UPI000C220DA4